MSPGDASSNNHPLGKGSMILDPEPCPKCGYNLQGLHRGGVCPECGRGITSGARGARARMLDAPRGYLLRVAFIALMMGWAGIGVFIVAAIPAVMTSLPFIRTMSFVGGVTKIAVGGALIASAIWTLGCLSLCRPRPGFTTKNPEPRQWAQRTMFTQPLWPIAFVLAGVAMLTGVDALYYAAYLCGWIAGVGLLAAAMHLAEYADWADDLELGIKFRTAGWMIAAGAVVDGVYRIAALSESVLTIIIAIVWVFAMLMMLGGLFLISGRCIQLATVVRWAILNSKDAEDRDARLVEKAEEERRERERRVAAQLAAADPDPGPIADGKPRAASGERVIEATDDQPYGLEDP